MKSRITHGVISIVLAMSAQLTNADVQLVPDVAGEAIEGRFVTGELVSVTFNLSSGGNKAVLGVELDLACAGDSIRIKDVQINPVFSMALGIDRMALPGKRCHLVRIQSLGNVDQAIGTAASPTWFARVDVEILTDAPFRSALSYRAHGVTVGSRPTPRASRTSRSEKRAENRGSIVVVNTAPPPAISGNVPTPTLPQPEPWTIQTANATIEVRSLGGSDAMAALAPNTAYELHYQVDFDHVLDYVAFVVSPTEGAGVRLAGPPNGGYWAGMDVWFHNFEADDPFGPPRQAPNFENGYLRRQMVTTNPDDYDTNGTANGSGHLFDFTTGSEPGEIVFDVLLWWTDLEGHQDVNMGAQTALAIERTR